jgi:hypothetical protein
MSLLVLLLGGTALADRIPERQRRVPQARVEPAPVRHDTKFQAVPDAKLEMRAVQYDGSTNGRLHVQVRNPARTAQKFSAKGLYFVPEGDPNSAPQRLGAVGPMQIAGDGKEVSELEVAPGATVDVVLDVFCIDSHRASPSPQNKFSIGVKKMPKELVQNHACRVVHHYVRRVGGRVPRTQPRPFGAQVGQVVDLRRCGISSGNQKQ